MNRQTLRTGVCWFCIFIVGCATTSQRREITGARYVIDDIELKGATRFKKKELLDYLSVGETSWVPFTEKFYFNEALVPLDAKRIVALYRSYGYYDAQVLTISAKPVEKDADAVDLVISVREGEPIKMSRIVFVWPEGPPQCSHGDCPTAQAVQARSVLKANAPLEVPRVKRSAAAIKRSLLESGFVLAQVDVQTEVDRDTRKAVVTFAIKPGRFARMAAVRFVGLKRVREKLVAREVDFVPGQPFSPKLLKKVEKTVYDMDVFSTVEVTPGKTIDDQGRIPLTVAVTESKLQSIEVGVGLGFEPTRWEERFTTQYTHRSIFGELTRFDMRLMAGYAELPTPFTLREHGPVLKLEPRLTKKGFLEKRMVWTAAAAFELGIDEGYQFYSPSTRLSVSRFFAEILKVGLSYDLRFVDFFNIADTLDANRSLLGLDFRDPYILSYVELETRIYFTDRIFEPRNGVVVGARYALAGGPFGGHFDYQKISPEIRAYWRIWPRLQLAGRVETGAILPYGDRPAAPFNMKFYLGGADSVRGWGLKRLAPKTEICLGDQSQDCRGIPIGGNTEVLGNIELRLRTVGDLYMAAFVDVGDVQAGELVYRPNEWNYAAGGGLRYDSPIGKFRLDFGVRLNDTPLSVGEDKWAFHIGLGESF